jgi:type IV pilus assembly protein PilO
MLQFGGLLVGELMEKVIELTNVIKAAILLGAVILLVALFWFTLFGPTLKEIASLSKEIDGSKGMRAKIAEQQAIVKNLKRFKDEVAMLDVELTKALQELPDKKEIYLLLSKISDRATGSGLTVRLFKPQAEQKKDFYAEVPVSVEVAGSFHQVATFLDEVGHLDRIVNIEKINMSDPQMIEGQMNLTTSMVATAFRFLDEAERPSESAGSQDGKKHRRKRPQKDQKTDDL